MTRSKSGATLAADVVVVGLGVAPATGMLQRVEPRKDGGVDTNARLGIANGLYAAGDIAAFPYGSEGARIRVEHWRVAMQQGRIAALNMLGREAVFDAIPYFWTIHFKKRLDYVGHAENWDEVAIDGDLKKPEFTAFYVKGGSVQAVAGWGRDQAMARAIGLLRNRSDWDLPALRAALAA
jgi:apoptosis-inducing factor 3